MADYNLYVDVINKRFVKSFTEDTAANAISFTQGDTPTVQIQFLEPVVNVASTGSVLSSITRPFQYVDYTGYTIRMGIGKPGDKPDFGTFTLTYGANTTAAIQYNASAADVQAALNALTSIQSAGLVTVSGGAGGAWEVIFNSVGVRTSIAGTPTGLYPLSSVVINQAQAGTVSVQEIQRVFLYRNPAVYQNSFTALPVAAVAVSVLQVGGGGANAVQKITLDPNPYDGTFSITLGAYTTNPIAYNASASVVQAALQALVSIGANNCSVVLNNDGSWTVTFVGALANTAVSTMTGNAAGLSVPLGFTSNLAINTVGVDELIGDSPSATTTIEIETVSPGGDKLTAVQSTATLVNDLIDAAATVPAPVDSYYTQVQALAFFVQNRFSITTLVGGAGCLDGISPTGGAQPGWVVKINNAQGEWALFAGTHAQDAAGGFVRVYDYDASTNAFYWKEIG